MGPAHNNTPQLKEASPGVLAPQDPKYIYAAELLRLRRRHATTTPIPIPRPTSVIAKMLGSGTRAVGLGVGRCANTEAGTARRVKRHVAANLELMSFILISPDELFLSQDNSKDAGTHPKCA
jgi:hypothetical protein